MAQGSSATYASYDTEGEDEEFCGSASLNQMRIIVIPPES
ncbi:hypothetical protein ACPOL_4274 [Acidisarcina polymorpha]|uniref:Uncharacterized protein n=1 Tax=Acidisarcina polymorpha TaxID=2211140 RepID=A0A2Z5G3A6_9BACT|nr:hypothetical protein ACPOL_4274 [Acidisarcina polymorpha]